MSNRRLSGRFLVALAAAAILLLPLTASQAQPDQSTVPGKKFAAYEYWWYPIEFVDHFDNRLNTRRWEKTGLGVAKTQNGMLTLESNPDGQAENIGVILRHNNHDRGRWEIRLRGNRMFGQTGETNYTVAAELIPAAGLDYHCGARNIGFASFRPGVDSAARFHIRNLPDQQFTSVKRRMNLSDGYWHTYAVQVTPKRIAWFTDGVARAVENRPEALSGIQLTLRLELQAVEGATMNPSRLQVDTVRYFTLKTPSKKPVTGTLPTQGTYADAC